VNVTALVMMVASTPALVLVLKVADGDDPG
jgi:hypothetical protein